MICKINGCETKKFSLGYCIKHYKRFIRNGDPLITKNERHNKSNSNEYRSWHMMLQRCFNPKNTGYKNYGGRGITVCSRWKKSFSNFYSDMGNRPKGKTLNRINNEGNYEPNNCEWSSYIQQNNNQRKRKNNTSGFTGVHWNKQGNNWRASITIRGKIYNLGHFKDITKAIKVREVAVKKKQVW
jgi:hypothetical protein